MIYTAKLMKILETSSASRQELLTFLECHVWVKGGGWHHWKGDTLEFESVYFTSNESKGVNK